MRLIEVVMLMGAHCVSPVEHSTLMTDATKVQCAVVMEKDTERGTLTVTPPAAAADPQVAAAVERFRLAPVDGAGGTKIVPAWAPAGVPPSEVKPTRQEPPAAPRAATPPPATLQASETPPVPPEAGAKPEARLALLSPPPPKRTPARATVAPARPKAATKQGAATPKAASQCKGSAVAKWYTTGDGRKKYRCVKPVSDSAPNQLY